MYRYIRFDAEAFLKDSRHWDNEIRQAKAELESISELKAIESNGGKSSTISDPTFNVARQREKCQAKIDRLLMYKEALRYGMESLSEPQKEALEMFFFRNGYIPPLIEKYGSKHALCRSDVYRARREALEEFAYLITERYEL